MDSKSSLSAGVLICRWRTSTSTTRCFPSRTASWPLRWKLRGRSSKSSSKSRSSSSTAASPCDRRGVVYIHLSTRRPALGWTCDRVNLLCEAENSWIKMKIRSDYFVSLLYFNAFLVSRWGENTSESIFLLQWLPQFSTNWKQHVVFHIVSSRWPPRHSAYTGYCQFLICCCFFFKLKKADYYYYFFFYKHFVSFSICFDSLN